MKENHGVRVSPRLIEQAADALAAVLPDGAPDRPALFTVPQGTSRRQLPAWSRNTPADQRLGFWLRRHPSLGSRERRWLSDRVYDVLRQGRAYETFLQQADEAAPLRPAQDAAGLPPAGEAHASQPGDVAAFPQAAGAETGTSAWLLPALIRLSALVGQASTDAAAAPGPEGAAAVRSAGIEDGGDGDARPVGHGDGLPAEAAPLAGMAAAFHHWLSHQPPAVRYSLPDWLWQGIEAAHGDQAATLAAHLLLPASIDIRSNLLKGKASALQKHLAAAGIEAVPVPDVPTALRVKGRPALARLPLFEQGWFELQDAGSQAIVESCGARRGAKVIDLCAGAGGKTLALAARMRNQGQMLAFDTEDSRLARLAPRLKRAGVDIVTPMRIGDSADARLARYQGWADLVLVDAPCSGSGTLRRHPDLKWRLQPDDVAHYQQLQRSIVLAALRLLRPGGRLVYATCSLLADENAQQMQWLAQSLGSRWTSPLQRHWLPGEEGGDAFFMAVWEPVR